MNIQSGVTYASGKSIRKYIKRRSGLERHLFWNRVHKKSGPKKKNKVEKLKDRAFIDQRPPEAEYEYGHWEGDFIVSKQNSWALLVLVEKQSKQTLVERIPNRKNVLVNNRIVEMLKRYSVKSLTLDNDIAFQKHKKLAEMLNTNIYFCHPYHSWEKGLVENMNRWIRVFVPKKTNIGSITDEYVKSIENWMNYTPNNFSLFFICS